MICESKNSYISKMGTKATTSYKIGNQNALHYITIATVGWLEYIHNNPVEEGIVQNAEDYLYSSE